MSNEPNTRLSGMKQDIQNTRTGFTQSLAPSHGSIDQKFDNINSQSINMTLQKPWKIYSMIFCQKLKTR